MKRTLRVSHLAREWSNVDYMKRIVFSDWQSSFEVSRGHIVKHL